ncbi:MAG: PAS domain S-box protein, partial [Magnetococcales bacterium]|nr:PAS domain S-box protein [Magnetococcales bacterium]
MKRGTLLRWGLGVLCGVLITWFALRSQVDQRPYRAIEQLVARMVTLEARINQNLVQIRHDILRHYDDIAAYRQENVEALKKAESLALPLDGEAAEYREALSQVRNDVEKKRDLINRFLTRYALLKNSLAYLSVLVTEKSALDRVIPATGSAISSARIHDLLQKILLHAANPGVSPLSATATQQIEELSKVDELVSIAAHARIVLEGELEVERLIGLMVNLPLADSWNQLAYLSARHLQQRQEGATRYQIVLFFSSLIFLGLLVHVLLRLNTSTLRQRRLQQAVEASEDAILLADLTGKIEYANPGFARLSGLPPHEILGRRIVELDRILPDGSERETVREAMAAGQSWRGSLPIRGTGGPGAESDTPIWQQIRLTPIHTASGRLSGFVVLFHDISHLKKTEEALLRAKGEAENANRIKGVINEILKLSLSQENLATLLDQALSGILGQSWLRIEAQGAIFLLDATHSRLIRVAHRGFPPALQQQCAEVPCDTCLCGRAAPQLEEFREMRMPELSSRNPLSLPIQSGKRFLGVLTLYVREGTRQEEIMEEYLVLITNTLASLIERKRAEEMLHKLSHAVEQSPVSVIITDMKGIIEYVNPKFTEQTGYSPEEAVGQHTRILKSGYSSSEEYQSLWQTILAGQEWHGEFRTRKKDGELFWESVSISPLRAHSGEITHFVAVKEDITGRKEMDSQLRQAKLSAEQANRAKSEFLANMSHEIRTPMNAIIGMTSLCLQTGPTLKQEDYLRKIDRAAHSLLRILNDILDFSKIEAGRLEMERVAFRLDGVLDQVATLLAFKATEKGLHFRVSRDAALPSVLVGDPLRLEQVLLNLAGNAVKFTHEGEVEVKAVPEARSEGEVTVGFTVRDTGIGLNAEQTERLFQAFSQADTSTTRRYGGTGLGLSISKRLVEMMQGTISVQSEVGKGSLFAFTARFGIAPEAEAMELSGLVKLSLEDYRQVLSAALTKPILLVEDNPFNQQVAKEMLELVGATVCLAANGQEALECLESQPCQAVLMDLQMPVLDGYEATRLIRLQSEFESLPIIAMTANAMSGERENCLAAGMDDYLTKPVGMDQLFAILAKHLCSEEVLARHSQGKVRQITTEPDILPEVSGLRPEQALTRLGGNRALYLSLLQRFIEGSHQADIDLRRRLTDGDDAGAKRLLHTLKGIAGTLGAVAFQEHCQVLEEELHRDGELVPARLEEFGQLLMGVVGSVEEAIRVLQPHREDRVSAIAGKTEREGVLPVVEEMLVHVRASRPRPCMALLPRMKMLAGQGEVAACVGRVETMLKHYRMKEALA